jgi:adenine-specific DNA-methyltransferase
MPEKMKFETPDGNAANVAKIAELFPAAVSDGKVNFEMLRALLGDEIYGDEAYEFTWVGKREAVREAGRPVRKTLRPCPEESKEWDTTENLYIEGDNLDVLKLLQESYLGKVKMIYIDPPYNTGNDFVYRDRFAQNREEYEEEAGVYDEDGDRLFKNTETNGRFHSDWCSMIYPRLVLARNLLRDDGVIFISIDDNEVAQLRKICDEVFGESNYIGQISNVNNPKGRSDDKFIASSEEFLLVYAKTIDSTSWYGFEQGKEIITRYNKTDLDGRKYRNIDLRKTGTNDLRSDRPNMWYPFFYHEVTETLSLVRLHNDDVEIYPLHGDSTQGCWRWGRETAIEKLNTLVACYSAGKRMWVIMEKDYYNNSRLIKPTSTWTFKDVNSERGSEELRDLGFNKLVFKNPKTVGLLKRCLTLATRNNDIVLDFFSGSATTAHAVMQLNAEDGGNRKFIMVQLPEVCAEGTEAAKAGYANICEIGKERIRRAGDKIKSELANRQQRLSFSERERERERERENTSQYPPVLDIGFRVLKLDESNMKDVYYAAGDYDQNLLDMMTSNIKEGRTDMDLLYGRLLEWGLPLSLPHTHEEIGGVTVHTYNNGDLIACFADIVSEDVVKEIAKRQPLRAVFRDSSFVNSPAKINVEEIFKLLAPNASVIVI